MARIASFNEPLSRGHASTTRNNNRESGDESGDHPSGNPLISNGETVGSIPTAGAI